MITIGLTGSIGMGKSTTASLFAAEGVPVYDADAEVHALYASGGDAISAVEAAFPGVVTGGAIDREKLGARVLADPAALKTLEAIVHPRLQARRERFFTEAETNKAAMVVLDIPLLFETGGETELDVVVVVSAPEEIQRERVLLRPNMTVDKLDAILARQMRDAEKRARAHFVIDTGRGLDHTRGQVRSIIQTLRSPRWRQPKAMLDAGRKHPHG